VLLEALYLLIRSFETQWWWIAWIAWVLFTLVLGRLAPVLIFPLFYKFKPLEDESLRQRIISMVQDGGLHLQNVYVFNMSKTTKKANAAFCGMGKTRRVILADTLIENFNSDEIQMVVAHEMGHCTLKHIWKRVLWGILFACLAFFWVYQISTTLVSHFGLNGVQDIASLPLIFVLFFLFSFFLIPLENTYSRKHEYEADLFAIKILPDKSTFSSMMNKLAKLNLADVNPHPLIEFLLYDHPPIE